MVAEVLTALEPCTGGTYVDGTLGGGGHAEAILIASAPAGKLYGCDRDGAAVEAAARRLALFAGRFEISRRSYSELAGWIDPNRCDAVLLDLGVSSPQLERPERGFSLQSDGPLDMRMDDRQILTAYDLVNNTRWEELARLFRVLGGEREAGRVARAIDRERRSGPIARTRQLAGLIERVNPRRGGKIHPATRVFQALRIAVNDEIELLVKGLEVVWGLLKPGGKLAVITFHSLEDQIVKRFGRERTRDYTFPGEVDVPELRQPVLPTAKWFSRKAIQPSLAELAENPRSRSAQLRVLEKLR